MAIWSGRPDPDGNISPWVASDGFLNWGKYSNPELDKVLAQARQITDDKERAKTLFAKRRRFTSPTCRSSRSITTSRSGRRAAISTVSCPIPDGLIRLQGVKKG